MLSSSRFRRWVEGEPFPCFDKCLNSESLVTGGGGYVKNVPVKSAGTYGALKNLNVRLQGYLRL